jgi:hypothetical protein
MVLTALGGGVTFASITSSLSHANELLPTVIRYKTSVFPVRTITDLSQLINSLREENENWIVIKNNQL